MADEAGGPKRTETTISDATRRAEPYPDAGGHAEVPRETYRLNGSLAGLSRKKRHEQTEDVDDEEAQWTVVTAARAGRPRTRATTQLDQRPLSRPPTPPFAVLDNDVSAPHSSAGIRTINSDDARQPRPKKSRPSGIPREDTLDFSDPNLTPEPSPASPTNAQVNHDGNRPRTNITREVSESETEGRHEVRTRYPEHNPSRLTPCTIIDAGHIQRGPPSHERRQRRRHACPCAPCRRSGHAHQRTDSRHGRDSGGATDACAR
jgi:hypothetical protein